MKQPRLILRLLLLCLCLALLACGCEAPATAGTSEPAATQPIQQAPLPGAERLELEGRDLGPVYELEGSRYLRLASLAECLEGWTWTEEGTNALRLTRPALGNSSASAPVQLTLRAGSDLAVIETADLEASLGAPVIHQGEDWFLPLSGSESLFNCRSLYDPEANCRRLLRLGSAPLICAEEGEALLALSCEGSILLPARSVADLLGGSLEAEADPDGTPALTLRAGERILRCRADEATAELDGESLALSVPAWPRAEDWFLPLEAAEALGCVLLPDEAYHCRRLLAPKEGDRLWFNGRDLGPALNLGDTPCYRLSGLAEALGGELRFRGNDVTLTAGGHSLRFQVGESTLEADGNPLTLPQPTLLLGGEWLVPLRPVAEALGLRDLSGQEGLIFSGIEARETVLYIDGRQAPAYGLPEGPLLLRLGDAAALAVEQTEDGLTVAFRDRQVTLAAGDTVLQVGEEALPLSAPVYADGSDLYAPATELLEALGLTELLDPELDQRYYTWIVRHEDVAEGYRVPVFMYHAVGDTILGSAELFVSPAAMEQQLKAIVEGGYTPITFEDLDRIEEIEKPVILTFDDGYIDAYTTLYPLLQKYNVKVTVFVIVDMIGGFYKMNEEQIRELSDSGLVSIQSHTMSHGFLSEKSASQLQHEHYDSMVEIARITGKQPFVMCYPTGKNSWASRQVTAEYYEYGLCMSGPCYVTGQGDPYLIYRYYVPRGLSLATFKAYLG